MSMIDPEAREINFKIAYQGPGLGGKTTNLYYIHNKTRPEVKSRMVSVATEDSRTLSFSFKPLSLGEIAGLTVRFHLYTVPGPVFYDISRRLILTGADAVVFVVDSQAERFDSNIEALINLEDNLATQGSEIDRMPLVFQYNKRDLANAVPVAELEAALNPKGRQSFEAVATTGLGVFDTLKAVCTQVLAEQRARHPR